MSAVADALEEVRVAPTENANPIDVMQHILATYAVQLSADPTWIILIKQVPQATRRELARRFGYMVLDVQA